MNRDLVLIKQQIRNREMNIYIANLIKYSIIIQYAL